MSKPLDVKITGRAIKDKAASVLDKVSPPADLSELPETPMLKLSDRKISTATRRKLRP